ncbi:MAG: polysaccharide deacetylase family protein [Bacteroidota bacterium]
MIILLITGTLVTLILAWLMLSYSFLIPPPKGLPILMYHKISENQADGLTLTAEQLDRQFRHIREKGYHTIYFEELSSIMQAGLCLPERSLIITFDDAYESFSSYVLPLLEKYNFKATVFVPVGYMGKTNVWDQGNDRIMTPEELKKLAGREHVEIGLHSFLHRNYGTLQIEEMKEDLANCINLLNANDLPFVRVLAYPYGGYPKKDKIRLGEMKNLFREVNLDFALRIGNRINPFPFKDPYILKRIDIKGTDNFLTFKIKLKKGRKKLFS